MPFQTSNDITLYYEQQGNGEDLILIGGLSADHNVWKTSLNILTKHFRVLTFDNRGAGQSSSPNIPYSTDMMAKDTVELMRALGIEKAHIIGHSMGGCITQKIAIRFPEFVKKAVIACARAKTSILANQILNMRIKLEAAGVDKNLLAEYSLPFLFNEKFLKNEVNMKGFVQWTLQNPFPQTFAGLKNQFLAVETHNILNEITQLKAPALIISGEYDILMPISAGKELADMLPNGNHAIIVNCAHMPHIEQPKAFAETILGFLKN